MTANPSSFISRGVARDDERLKALLSITARIDGFLYRCRNDSYFTMLYVSEGIQKVTGYPASEMIGNRLRNFSSIIHPDDLSAVYAAVDRALEARGNWDIDYRLMSSQGSPVWVHEIGAGVFNETGELEFLEGFIVNNTEHKQTEMALQEADARLQQINLNLERSLEEKKIALNSAEAASKAKSNFLAMMSHELRTPLNAVIGLSDLMGRRVHGELGSDKYVEYVGDINSSGRLLLTLIDEILDLTRIEAGNYDLEIELVSLAEIWARVVQPLETAAAAKKIRLSALLGPALFANQKLCLANAGAVGKIATKLVENAIKFTANGGEICIEVDEHKAQSELSLVVRDNGSGISADKIANVMKPFVQGSDGYSRDAGSVGLGLTICKLLADAMKGRIEIQSEVGKGTTVRLFLPAWSGNT